MSLLLHHFLRDMSRPLRMLENHVRLTDEVFNRWAAPFVVEQRRIDDPVNAAVVQNNDSKFEVKLNVQHFKPDEITVKTLMNGNAIEIEAKHEERQDETGYIARQFVRRFVLPQGHDLKAVVSKLSSDGILTVTAPKNVVEEEQEKIIPVTHVSTDENQNKE